MDRTNARSTLVNSIRVTLWMAASLALTGCSAVRIDYDPEHDFVSYKTFRMTDGETHPADALAADPLTKKRIVKAVDAVLQEKGFVLAEGGACDFSVVVHGTVSERVQIHDGGGMFVSYGGWGWRGGGAYLSTYEEGTVFIDIVDETTDELVWRGCLSRAVSHHKDPKRAEAAAEKMARQILKAFPPTPSGSL